MKFHKEVPLIVDMIFLFRNPLIGSGKRSNVNDTFKSERESEREFVTKLKEKFENPSSEESHFYQRYKSLLSSN